MSNIKDTFYSSSFYGFFRYYFIRKKSPLSYILWSNILKRDLMYESGVLNPFVLRKSELLRIETSIDTGAPQDNKIEFDVYDREGKFHKSFTAQLSYRDAKRIRSAAHEARNTLKELNKQAPTPK